MSITIDGEVIEIIDAHTHMGTRPDRESLQAEARDAKTGRAFLKLLWGRAGPEDHGRSGS